jgi:hypothetical protein
MDHREVRQVLRDTATVLEMIDAHLGINFPATQAFYRSVGAENNGEFHRAIEALYTKLARVDEAVRLYVREDACKICGEQIRADDEEAIVPGTYFDRCHKRCLPEWVEKRRQEEARRE